MPCMQLQFGWAGLVAWFGNGKHDRPCLGFRPCKERRPTCWAIVREAGELGCLALVGLELGSKNGPHLGLGIGPKLGLGLRPNKR